MGVKSLINFLRKARLPTKMDFSAASKHPRHRMQTIVFDAMSCLERYFQKGSYVQNFAAVRDNVLSDVQTFRMCGFDLAVVVSHNLYSRNLDKWVGGQANCAREVIEVNEKLRQGGFGERERKMVWNAPRWSSVFLSQAFRNAGCTVCDSVENAKAHMAWLGVERGAYGVLTDDEGILCYPDIARYLNSRSLEVEGRNVVLREVRKRDVLTRLGVSQPEFAAMAALLGTDSFEGWPTARKRQLETAWRVDTWVEAVANEVARTKKGGLPPECHAAVQHYMSAEPVVGLEHPATHLLLEKQVYIGGVILQDLHRTTCDTVLFPLRQAIYARNAVRRVTEYICSIGKTDEVVVTRQKVELNDGHPKAPDISEDPVAIVLMAADYLYAADGLSSNHHKALILQVMERSSLERETSYVQYPTTPALHDLHVENLFLETVQILQIGSSTRCPPCWDVFHGRLFHFLCQNEHITAKMEVDRKGMGVDWAPILESVVDTKEAELLPVEGVERVGRTEGQRRGVKVTKPVPRSAGPDLLGRNKKLDDWVDDWTEILKKGNTRNADV